ncbi:MAG: DUF5004 domain-containing protein [Bacteroidota bacterium]|nr:DUF5004 domain-containing protein [Bacteroidota bacterium]
MKRISTYFFILALVLSVTFCKKYPEGPSFSLRSKSERLSNLWKIQQLIYNGADSTAFAKKYLFNNYRLDINKNGNYNIDYNLVIGSVLIPFSESGNWVFSSDKKAVIFTKESGNTTAAMGSNATWEILRLKEKEFWAKYTQNDDVTEVHLN